VVRGSVWGCSFGKCLACLTACLTAVAIWRQVSEVLKRRKPRGCGAFCRWAYLDLNQGLHPYQGSSTPRQLPTFATRCHPGTRQPSRFAARRPETQAPLGLSVRLGMFDRGLTAASCGRHNLPSFDESTCRGFSKGLAAIIRAAVARTGGQSAEVQPPILPVMGGRLRSCMLLDVDGRMC
jgi:hypothetical protein